MAGESISIPILTPGADAAARNIKQVGDAAAGTGGKLDFAAGSLEAWNRAAANSAKADATSVNAFKAHTKAAQLAADAENVLAGKATTTTRLFADQAKKMDDASKSSTSLASRFSALAGTGGAGGGFAGGGMGVLIGAGIALSGQLTAVGFGLAGLAGAAYGVIKPITTAAQATGGLQQNLHTLNPEQQAVAKSLLALGHQYDAFQKSLAPQVLTAFNDAFRIAGHLMSDIQPIAKQTGNALNQVLLSVDKEFQSGTWQQFFRFLAQQAGPDVRLLGQNFTDLLQALPPLIQDLTPLGNVLLHVSDDAFKAAGGIAQFYKSFQQNVPISNEHTVNALRDLDSWVVHLTDHLGPWARAINNAGTSLQQNLGDGTGGAVASATAGLQHFQQVTIGTGPIMTGLVSKTITTAASVDRLGKTSLVTSMHIQETGRNAGLVVSPFDHLGKVADTLFGTFQNVASSGHAVAGAAGAVASAWRPVLSGTRLVTGEVAALNTQMTTLVGNLLTLQGSDLSWQQSLQSAKKQLDSNTAGLEGNTKNAVANKQAVLQSTQAAISFASQQLALGKNIDGASRTVQKQIDWLQSLHDKSAFVRSELAALRAEEAKLQAQRIDQRVSVNGIGRWSVAGPGGSFRSGQALAAGGRVPGAGNSDSYPAMLTPGEVVVPKRMVSSGVVDHLRGSLPGFAGGGLVPSYAGNVAGLAPWIKHNDTATISLIDQSVASATLAGIKAAVRAASGAPGALGGPTSASAAQAQAYARSRLGAYGWGGGEMGPLIALWNQESGWNRFAQNPASGAYGIPQALPPGKMGAAANPPLSSAAAQINWGLGYIRSVYGSPSAAEGHELAVHWYDRGGFLPPGVSMAVNGTGRPERVGGGGGNTYHITINVPPNANMAEIGRLNVQAIKEFERRSGAGWRN